MRSLENKSPLAALCYFLAVIGIAMFMRDLVVATVSLFFAVAFYIVRNGARNLKTHLYSLIFFILIIILNPFFYHNGATVLFMFGDNPMTLEALIYGVASAEMVVAVIYWFRSFSEIMTSDKLLSVFGAVSPKFSLMLSMVLRFIPLFTRQSKNVKSAQRALGMYKNDNIVDSVRVGARVFSGVSGWALENGIITADSMAARGYGTTRRTSFSLYRSKKADWIFIVVVALTFTAAVIGLTKGEAFRFYPEIVVPSGALSVSAYAVYAALCAISSILEIYEGAKWKYLTSKI